MPHSASTCSLSASGKTRLTACANVSTSMTSRGRLGSPLSTRRNGVSACHSSHAPLPTTLISKTSSVAGAYPSSMRPMP